MAKLPKPLNEAEETLALQCQCRIAHIPPTREYEFCPGRKWRFDFSWPKLRFAVEIEGGVHRIKGRFVRDIEKYNTATKMGWKLLRYTPEAIKKGTAIEEIVTMIVQISQAGV